MTRYTQAAAAKPTSTSTSPEAAVHSARSDSLRQDDSDTESSSLYYASSASQSLHQADASHPQPHR